MKKLRRWITLAPLVGLALFALVVASRLQLASADCVETRTRWSRSHR